MISKDENCCKRTSCYLLAGAGTMIQFLTLFILTPVTATSLEAHLSVAWNSLHFTKERLKREFSQKPKQIPAACLLRHSEEELRWRNIRLCAIHIDFLLRVLDIKGRNSAVVDVTEHHEKQHSYQATMTRCKTSQGACQRIKSQSKTGAWKAIP